MLEDQCKYGCWELPFFHEIICNSEQQVVFFNLWKMCDAGLEMLKSTGDKLLLKKKRDMEWYSDMHTFPLAI